LRGFDLVINTAIVQVPEINEKRRLGYEVNVLGTQNICRVVDSTPSIKGLLHAGSWHVFGERDIRGVLDENFGFHPEKIEERARLYALCKIAQESVIRITDQMSPKLYGIIRLGTVLGEGMPKLTAANLFVESALKREPMTPYRHTQHRPMLYVDINDVCKGFELFAKKILRNELAKGEATHIVNLVSPPPITIIGLARIVRAKFISVSNGEYHPRISVVDKGIEPLYAAEDSRRFRVDASNVYRLLRLKRLTTPSESIERIVRNRLAKKQ
jgi:nucleoside-diphosphate-sugar epimerase